MAQTGSQVRNVVTGSPLTCSVALGTPLTPPPGAFLALMVYTIASQIENAWESSRDWLKIRLCCSETVEGPANLHF